MNSEINIKNYEDFPDGIGARREFFGLKHKKDMTIKYAIFIAELLILIAQLADK